MHRLGTAGALDAVEHLGLGLEHLILAELLERAVGEPDQAEALEVVQVGGAAVSVPAPGGSVAIARTLLFTRRNYPAASGIRPGNRSVRSRERGLQLQLVLPQGAATRQRREAGTQQHRDRAFVGSQDAGS